MSLGIGGLELVGQGKTVIPADDLLRGNMSREGCLKGNIAVVKYGDRLMGWSMRIEMVLVRDGNRKETCH